MPRERDVALCYRPGDSVTRGQMAAFLVATFRLPYPWPAHAAPAQ
jgi:hypothetical protein